VEAAVTTDTADAVNWDVRLMPGEWPDDELQFNDWMPGDFEGFES
jgi:hypothetical protein